VSGVVLAALGVSLGTLGVVAGLRAQRQTLEMVFEVLDRDGTVSRHRASTTTTPIWRLDRALGARLGDWIEASSHKRRFSVARRSIAWGDFSVLGRLQPALKLTDSSFEILFSEVVLGAVAGALLPLVFWGIVSADNLRLSIIFPAWAAVLFAAGGTTLPFVALFSEAKKRRRAARTVVMSFLDLVVLCLAGGMGIEGALHAAAQVGDDPVSGRIHRALMLARDAGETPWDALGRVGTETGVEELNELAAAVGLAGSQGARVRATLAAKAASIRKHELADEEAEANTVTERLFLPGVLLLVGFLLFIGYPAVARIASGI
jgi:tight adherence protein C